MAGNRAAYDALNLCYFNLLAIAWLISHRAGTSTAIVMGKQPRKRAYRTHNLLAPTETDMTITLDNLSVSTDLDRAALVAIKGGSEWNQRSSGVVTNDWSAYSNMYKSYVGTTFHDGYLTRQYNEGWKRTRAQTEYSYWDHFVRV
jgi:hypothetical protein